MDDYPLSPTADAEYTKLFNHIDACTRVLI
jgi:hypothetical protein